MTKAPSESFEQPNANAGGHIELGELRVCGAWVGGKEVIHSHQLGPRRTRLPRTVPKGDPVAVAMARLGVTEGASPEELRKRLARLALRYPPEAHPEKHATFREAVEVLSSPLRKLQARMEGDPFDLAATYAQGNERVTS